MRTRAHLIHEFARSARCRRCKRRHVRRRVRPHRASRVRGPWTAGMATVSSSARADDAHAAWGDPGDSQPSSRLTASPSASVESGAACPDRLQTRLPSVAGACRVQRPAAATCPVFSPRRVTSASPDGGKRSRAASRRDGAFRSHEKPRGARFAAVWRNTAGRWRCPSRGSFVRGCRDHADRRGRARTASGARFFRPVGHGSRSETSCRRRAGGHLRASYV